MRLRPARVQAPFEVVNGEQHLVRRKLGLERRVDGDEEVFGAHVHGEDAAAADDAVVGLDDVAQLVERLVLHALAHEQPLGLAQQDDRHEAQQDADEDGGDAVEVEVAGHVADDRRDEREAQAELGGRVLQDDGVERRVLGVADELDRAHVAARGVELLDADAERDALDDDEVERRVAEHVGARHGLLDGLHALDQRHPAAHEEHEQRDDHGPEVELLAVSKRVQVVGLAVCPVQAEQHEHAVAGIDDGVNRFGEHCRRS